MLSVSRQSVHELIARKIIDRGDDGLIDVDLARSAIANRVRPSAKSAALVSAAQPPSAQPAEPASDDQAVTSYHVAKTLREAAEAQIARYKLAEMRGELVRSDAVKAAHQRLAAGLREALLQIPSRLAAVIAAESDQARCHALLEQELHQALAAITQA